MAVTITAPQSGYFDRTGAITVSWTNSITSPPQTAYEIMYKLKTASSWSTLGRVTSTATSANLKPIYDAVSQDAVEFYYKVVVYHDLATLSSGNKEGGVEHSAVYSIMFHGSQIATLKVQETASSTQTYPLFNGSTTPTAKLNVRTTSSATGTAPLVASGHPLAGRGKVITASGYTAFIGGSSPTFAASGQARYGYFYGYRYQYSFSYYNYNYANYAYDRFNNYISSYTLTYAYDRFNNYISSYYIGGYTTDYYSVGAWRDSGSNGTGNTRYYYWYNYIIYNAYYNYYASTSRFYTYFYYYYAYYERRATGPFLYSSGVAYNRLGYYYYLDSRYYSYYRRLYVRTPASYYTGGPWSYVTQRSGYAYNWLRRLYYIYARYGYYYRAGLYRYPTYGYYNQLVEHNVYGSRAYYFSSVYTGYFYRYYGYYVLSGRYNGGPAPVLSYTTINYGRAQYYYYTTATNPNAYAGGAGPTYYTFRYWTAPNGPWHFYNYSSRTTVYYYTLNAGAIWWWYYASGYWTHRYGYWEITTTSSRHPYYSPAYSRQYYLYNSGSYANYSRAYYLYISSYTNTNRYWYTNNLSYNYQYYTR